MKNKIWILLVFLLFVPNVLAEQVYKTGEQVELRRECFNDGNLCDSSFGCSLSIYHPDGSIILDNVSMEHQTNEGYYNYTVGTLLFNGEYRNRMTCTDGTLSGSEVFYFDITPTGDDRGNNLFLIFAIASGIFMVLGLIFKNNTLGFISGALFIVTGVYSMIYGIANLADVYTRLISFVMIGVGVLFIIASAYESIDG